MEHETQYMTKKTVILLLKLIILLMTFGSLIGFLWFPQTEGRATNLELVDIYMDPVIIYMYIASAPFFLALYQVFRFLGYVESNKAYSQEAIKAVRIVKYCAIAIPIFVIIAIAYIGLNSNGEDSAGPIALGSFITITSILIAAAVNILEKRVRNPDVHVN